MGWTWWLVRTGTPAEELETLRNAMGAAMARDDVRAQLDKIGFVPLDYGPEEYEAIVGPVAGQLEAMGNALAWEEAELKKLR